MSHPFLIMLRKEISLLFIRRKNRLRRIVVTLNFVQRKNPRYRFVFNAEEKNRVPLILVPKFIMLFHLKECMKGYQFMYKNIITN